MKKPRTITISERRANPDPFPSVAEPPTRRFADPFLPLADPPIRRSADPFLLAAHLSPLTTVDRRHVSPRPLGTAWNHQGSPKNLHDLAALIPRFTAQRHLAAIRL